MSKKIIKYAIAVVIIMIVLFNSVYFRNLDDVKAAEAAKQFDAATFAAEFWHDLLDSGLSKAVEVNHLTEWLKDKPEETFERYSNALGIGNIRYFLVQGQGVVQSVNENDVTLLTSANSLNNNVKIATEYIFGNAVRDASGLININDFTNTMDFNNVSAEINKIIRSKLIPSFRERINEGDTVIFTGAIELNKEHLSLKSIEVIPVKLEIIENKKI